MAKIMHGALASDIRNKLGPITPLTTPPTQYQGGVVFSRGIGGPYIRQHLEPDDPNTTAQQLMRAAYGDALTDWKDNLNDPQRTAWEAFGQQYPTKKPISGVTPLSGQAAFLRANILLRWLALSPLLDAPGNLAVTQPEQLELTFNNATGIAYDNFDRADSPNPGADWDLQSADSVQIFSHQAAPHKAAGNAWAEWNADSFSADQFSQVKVTALGAPGKSWGLALRSTFAAADFYVCDWYASTTRIGAYVGGTLHDVAYIYNTPVNGDVVRFQITGTKLSLLINGAAAYGPVTTTRIATGRPGLYGYGDSTTHLNDNWLGGNYDANPPLSITLATAGAAGEVLVVRATPPLSPGILSTRRHMKQIGVYTCPLTYPLDIFWDWKQTYDVFTPPLGTPTTGKRIGVECYFVRASNGASSQRLIAQSLTT
jgi:hypothetical protein